MRWIRMRWIRALRVRLWLLLWLVGTIRHLAPAAPHHRSLPAGACSLCIGLQPAAPPAGRCYTHGVVACQAMDFALFASAVAPKGVTVILPALAGAGILVFLSQLFVPKT